MENLLVVNRFIPKFPTRLTAGLASTAIATLFMYFFFSNQSGSAAVAVGIAFLI